MGGVGLIRPGTLSPVRIRIASRCRCDGPAGAVMFHDLRNVPEKFIFKSLLRGPIGDRGEFLSPFFT